MAELRVGWGYGSAEREAVSAFADRGKWQITWRLETGFLAGWGGLEAAAAHPGSPGPDSRLR
jgi:hypothetical protein